MVLTSPESNIITEKGKKHILVSFNRSFEESYIKCCLLFIAIDLKLIIKDIYQEILVYNVQNKSGYGKNVRHCAITDTALDGRI